LFQRFPAEQRFCTLPLGLGKVRVKMCVLCYVSACCLHRAKIAGKLGGVAGYRANTAQLELTGGGLQNRCSTTELTRQINELQKRGSSFVLTA
jgi:hypothetical protein